MRLCAAPGPCNPVPAADVPALPDSPDFRDTIGTLKHKGKPVTEISVSR
jgi:hypothetical protein